MNYQKIKSFISNFLKVTLKIIFGCLGCLTITIIILFILCVIFVCIFEDAPPKSDYCIEDGDCKEGRILLINDKEVEVTKENCLKNNGEWRKTKNFNYCKLHIGTFWVKEVIYD